MKLIEFPEVNIRIAEHQEEFHTIPANIDPSDPTYPFTFCVELSPEELSEVIMNKGKVWITQWTGGNLFQPILVRTLKPELVKYDLTPFLQRPFKDKDDTEKI